MATIFTVQPGEVWRVDYNFVGGTFMKEACLTDGCSFQSQPFVGRLPSLDQPGYSATSNGYTYTCGFFDAGNPPTGVSVSDIFGTLIGTGGSCSHNGDTMGRGDFYVDHSILTGFNGVFEVIVVGAWNAAPAATLISSVPLPAAFPMLAVALLCVVLLGARRHAKT